MRLAIIQHGYPPLHPITYPEIQLLCLRVSIPYWLVPVCETSETNTIPIYTSALMVLQSGYVIIAVISCVFHSSVLFIQLFFVWYAADLVRSMVVSYSIQIADQYSNAPVNR